MKTYNVTTQIYYIRQNNYNGPLPNIGPTNVIKVFANDPNDAITKAKAIQLFNLPVPVGSSAGIKIIAVSEFNACSTQIIEINKLPVARNNK